MTPIPVLVVVNDLLRGGAQRIAADIVEHADRSRFSFTIVYFNASQGSDTLAVSLTAVGANLVHIGKGNAFRNLSALIAHIRKTKPACILSLLPYSSILARVAGFLSGAPVISVQCNLPFTYPPLVRALDAITLPLTRAWLAATTGIEAAYSSVPPAPFSREAWEKGRRHFTLYGGVDSEHIFKEAHIADAQIVRAEFDIPEDTPIIASVARLISWKGNDVLAALAQVPSAHLLLVGWGPLDGALKEKAKELGISDRVHFLGRRADVYRLLGAADCYAQAHRSSGAHTWEGPNLSQMEACAACVPSVSTAVPRVEELIEDGVTGRLARVNDPVDLARAIREMLSDKESAQRMAKVARVRVEQQFGLARMVSVYEALFELSARS